MSDPVLEIIEYCKHESFVNEMPNLGKMAEAAATAHADLLASMELYHETLRKTEAANAAQYYEIIQKDAALAAAREVVGDDYILTDSRGRVLVDHARYMALVSALDALPAPATEGK